MFTPLTLSMRLLALLETKIRALSMGISWRENVGGRRIRRTAVIGTIDEYRTEELAWAALNGFRV